MNVKLYAQIMGIYIPSKKELNGKKAMVISLRQKQMLAANKLSYSALPWFGQATPIIADVEKRKRLGLAKPEQIEVLYKYGVPAYKIRRMTEAGAVRKIQQIKALG